MDARTRRRRQWWDAMTVSSGVRAHRASARRVGGTRCARSTKGAAHARQGDSPGRAHTHIHTLPHNTFIVTLNKHTRGGTVAWRGARRKTDRAGCRRGAERCCVTAVVSATLSAQRAPIAPHPAAAARANGGARAPGTAPTTPARAGAALGATSQHHRRGHSRCPTAPLVPAPGHTHTREHSAAAPSHQARPPARRAPHPLACPAECDCSRASNYYRTLLNAGGAPRARTP